MINRIVVLTILMLNFTTPSTLLAGDNPFISKEPDKKVVKSVRYPGFIQIVLSKIAPLQHKLNCRLTGLTKEIKDTHSQKALFIIIIISFIYGIIHALGPGHGKTLTFSYFLLKQANIKKVIIAGILIAFLHAGSALVIVLALYFIIKQAYLTTFEDISSTIKLISYALIMLIGLFLLIKIFIDLKRPQEISQKQINTKNMFPIALAVGMIPCPGAVIILLVTISMEVLRVGIISIVIMAMGMAFTISSVGVLTIITKKGVLKFISNRTKARSIFQTVAGIIGALLILCFGAFLFIASI